MKENWTYRKLGEIAIFRRGLTYSKKDECQSSSKGVLRSNNVDLLTHKIDLSEIKYLREDFVIPEDKKVVKGTLLMCMSNGSMQHLGKVALIEEDFNYAFGGFMGLIIPSNVNERYLFYSLTSSSFKNYLAALTNGVLINNIKFSDLCNYLVPVPPLSEQERIVGELDLLNGIVDRKRQQLRELDTLAQSIFYHLFGDPVANAKGWEVKKLGEIAKICIGLTYKPEDVCEEGTIVLRSSNIQEGRLDFKDIVRVSKEIPDKMFVKMGDILMCSRNGSFRLVGKCTMIPELQEEMTYGAFMTIIRSPYNEYLCQYFKTEEFRSTLLSAKTTTINQITVNMLNNMSIAIPDIDLQHRFAERIQEIERQKSLIRQSLEETQFLLAYTMDKHFATEQ